MDTKISSFTNRYALSKTLRFKLIPVGKTQEMFLSRNLLAEDEERKEDYSKVKAIIDDYHKSFINDVLSAPDIIDVQEYADIYYKANKTDKDKKAVRTIESKLRVEIASALTKDKRYSILFKKELFTDILPGFIGDDDEKK